jgi:hypothetical protein
MTAVLSTGFHALVDDEHLDVLFDELNDVVAA